LSDAGYEFKIVPPDESVEQGLCSKCSPADIVIGADTVGECQGRILGKPVDADHARQMLELMSGKEHRVLTGVCLWHRPSDKQVLHVEQTVLTMDVLSADWLEAYLETDGWIGKAGAFGFQDGLDWIRINKGLESNVVGFPVERLDDLLEKLMKAVNN